MQKIAQQGNDSRVGVNERASQVRHTAKKLDSSNFDDLAPPEPLLECNRALCFLSSSLSSRQLGRNVAAAAMLDTVMVKFPCRLRVRLPGRQKLSVTPGLKIWADQFGTSLEKAEFSLPTLLFGHNGKVVSTQTEIDAALARVRDLLNEIAVVPDLADWDPRRVDLTWNFALNAGPIILVHASLRVPGIVAGATLHNAGQGVSWKGAKSHKVITIYDKASRMRVPGSVLRAEVSLRAQQVLRYLPDNSWRCFESLYRVYRLFLITIPSVQRSIKAGGFPEAIGLEPPETRARILSRLAHRPARTFRRYRQRVETAAAQLEHPFSWSELLPENAPPPPVAVLGRDRRRYRPKCLQMLPRPISFNAE